MFIGTTQSYAPYPGQPGHGGRRNGGVKNPDGVSLPTKAGRGDGVSGYIPMHMGKVLDVGVGCAGTPGQFGGAGTDRSPGGTAGWGAGVRRRPGQGYRSILDPRGEGGGSGDSGGGGASGVRESDWARTLLLAGGGGGAVGAQLLHQLRLLRRSPDRRQELRQPRHHRAGLSFITPISG